MRLTGEGNLQLVSEMPHKFLTKQGNQEVTGSLKGISMSQKNHRILVVFVSLCLLQQNVLL